LGIDNQPINLIQLRRLGGPEPSVIPAKHPSNYYIPYLENIKQLRAMLSESIDTDYLVTPEIEAMNSLGLIPKETINYLDRGQALGLLKKYEVGIGLQKKYAELMATG
jgi:hypothetical protein